MIQYFQSRGDRERALSYYDRMVRARVRPTDHTWRLLLDAYGTIEPVDERSALDVFARIRRDDAVKLSGLHWASLISMYGVGLRNADRAVTTFESIATDPWSSRAQPRLPDAIVYEALFNALHLNQRHDLVGTYRQRMARDGVIMSACACSSSGHELTAADIANTLISSYAAQGDLAEARHIFDMLFDPPAGVAAPTARQIKDAKRVQGVARASASSNDRIYREPSTCVVFCSESTDWRSYEALIKAEVAAGEMERAQALYDRAVARAFPLAVVKQLEAHLSPPSATL